ncbi:MAG: lipopolysaccharide biosynthesis protein [Gemmatimonadales bacterium]|nr:MAG: lipopolysaccharide biosynthesis protein [Gemmatimonadales bacterium]
MGECPIHRVRLPSPRPSTGSAAVSDLRRIAQRPIYYLQNFLRDVTPQVLFRSRLRGILGDLNRYDRHEIADRVAYYNKLRHSFTLGDTATTMDRISTKHSMYYYDLTQHARYFPRHLRLHYVFGDITAVPDIPSFLKSRPIAGDNENAVLLNLVKLRHFYFPRDRVPFEAKKGMAVWRGSLGRNNPKRRALLKRYRDHALCNVGYTRSKLSEDIPPSPYLPPGAQLRYRYIISIEGNDVATNLKWIMASNSLCLMPRPVYETWFMEGRLEPGKCFVQLRDDLADLEEKILYYEKHWDEARAIIQNANRSTLGFRDARKERLISLLVMYQYFVLSGQMEPDEQIGTMLMR